MDVGVLEGCSTAEVADGIDQLHALTSATHAQLLRLVADYDRREAWREDGATSMASWLVARLGIAHRHAAEWVRVARRLEELPATAASYTEARLSFDQLAPLTKLAAPETEQAMAEQAPACTAAQLEAAARRARPVSTPEANESHPGAACACVGTARVTGCGSRDAWPLPRERWWNGRSSASPKPPRPIR